MYPAHLGILTYIISEAPFKFNGKWKFWLLRFNVRRNFKGVSIICSVQGLIHGIASENVLVIDISKVVPLGNCSTKVLWAKLLKNILHHQMKYVTAWILRCKVVLSLLFILLLLFVSFTKELITGFLYTSFNSRKYLSAGVSHSKL